MEPDKLLTFSIEYISDYLTAFFATLTKPRLLFAPIVIESKIMTLSSDSQRTSLSPKLLGYATISAILGLSIQSVIPASKYASISLTTGIIIIGMWLIYATLASAIFFRVLKGARFLDLISVNMQIIATQYVISCLFALLWGIVYRVPIINDYLSQSSSFIRLIGENPILVYFGFQLILLAIFVPYALVNTFSHKKSVYIAVILLTMLTFGCVAFNFALWSSTQVLYCKNCGGGNYYPTATATTVIFPTSTATPFPSPTITQAVPTATP